jgi:hypothetical protein
MTDRIPRLDTVRDYLTGLQDRICAAIEGADGSARFHEDAWTKDPASSPIRGGGRTRVLRDGAVFEQAGIGFSDVSGDRLPPSATANRPELAGASWRAVGVSLVFHPRNPYVPTTHANVRHFRAERDGETVAWWFGGGFDLTPFDLVLLILIGNAVQNGINGGDNSLTGAFVMATTLIALNYAVAFVTSRSRKAERLVEGVPVVLARNGKVFERVLREQLVSDEDFHKALRQHALAEVSDVALALLETNGSISIVPREAGGSDRAAQYLAYFDGAKDQASDGSSDSQSRGRR